MTHTSGFGRASIAVLVLLLSLAGLSAIAADLPPASIPWIADRPLTWADFQAAPPAWAEPTLPVGGGTVVFTPAVTCVSITWSTSIVASCNGTTLTARISSMTVSNTMDPSKSWKLSAYVTAATLRHEQFHFNLHEVYRRLIETTIAPLTITQKLSSAAECVNATAQVCARSLSELANSTGSAILARASAAHAAYDAETMGGRNTAAQAAWESRITALLANPAGAP